MRWPQQLMQFCNINRPACGKLQCHGEGLPSRSMEEIIRNNCCDVTDPHFHQPRYVARHWLKAIGVIKPKGKRGLGLKKEGNFLNRGTHCICWGDGLEKDLMPSRVLWLWGNDWVKSQNTLLPLFRMQPQFKGTNLSTCRTQYMQHLKLSHFSLQLGEFQNDSHAFHRVYCRQEALTPVLLHYLCFLLLLHSLWAAGCSCFEVNAKQSSETVKEFIHSLKSEGDVRKIKMLHFKYVAVSFGSSCMFAQHSSIMNGKRKKPTGHF